MTHLCFFNSIPSWGGGERFYLDYARGFQEKGYQVWLAGDPEGVLAHKAAEAQLPFFPIRVGRLSFLNPFKLWRLRQWLRREQIDTLICSTSQDLKLAALAAKWAGLPRIVYRRGLAVPVKARPLNRYLFRRVLTHLIANSEATKQSLLQHLEPYVPPARIQVIYNGLPPEALDSRPRPPLPAFTQQGRGLILGNAGRLTAQKGQLQLIELARILKQRGLAFTLFIAGTGVLQAELAQKIAAYDLEREVVLLGFVEDMRAFMQGLDVFVLSSTWEGFGYVLAEAMAQARPVLAWDLSSNPELVQHEKTGYLLPYPDLEAFADQVQRLSENPKLRQRLGQAGRQRVEQRFRFESLLEAFEAYLQGEERGVRGEE